jgi:RHS repeat-associated protein
MIPRTLKIRRIIFKYYTPKRRTNWKLPYNTYDGDGQRVKSVINGTTTAFVGNYFEWTGSTASMVSYYYAGTTRLAMRNSTGVQWLLGDHLGSTSVVVNASGVVQSTQLYKPWGESRYSSSASPTKYLYTGQMKEGGLGGAEGLYDYGARWYDPSLGRFAQADTIIPEASQGTQAWDRFAYANNNPVRYNDPSGHCIGPLMLACIVVAEAIPYIMVAVGAVLTFGSIPGDSRIYEPLPGTIDPGVQFVLGVELAITGLSAIPPASISNASNIAEEATSTSAIVPYDPKFAASQIVQNGEASVSTMEAMIPSGTPNTFVPSQTIPAGYKYQFDINGTPIELKWHAPDANASTRYGPSSVAGNQWTAQIKVGRNPGELLGIDGYWYEQQRGNTTHIRLAK